MNLFMKAKFYLTEPKMEEASFAVFRKVKKLYQVTKFEDFHVLHMSAFEHGDVSEVSFKLTPRLQIMHFVYRFRCQQIGRL